MKSKWLYKGQYIDSPIPDAIGFVYCITNLETDKKYVGKKNFYKVIVRKPLKGQKRKRREQVESDWREYNSSSEHLQKDIELLGLDAFKFEIITPCDSKGNLSYEELKYQVTNDVLFRDDFYNSIIQCRIHRKHIKK